jgi:hypothetical protein
MFREIIVVFFSDNITNPANKLRVDYRVIERLTTSYVQLPLSFKNKAVCLDTVDLRKSVDTASQNSQCLKATYFDARS